MITGSKVKVEPLEIPNQLEVDMFVSLPNHVIIGEATLRASSKLYDTLKEKVETLRKLKPDLLPEGKKVIYAIYTYHPTYDLLELAKATPNIYLFNLFRDYTELILN